MDRDKGNRDKNDRDHFLVSLSGLSHEPEAIPKPAQISVGDTFSGTVFDFERGSNSTQDSRDPKR